MSWDKKHLYFKITMFGKHITQEILLMKMRLQMTRDILL